MARNGKTYGFGSGSTRRVGMNNQEAKYRTKNSRPIKAARMPVKIKKR